VYKLLAEVFCIAESKLLLVAVDTITFWKIETFERLRKQITAKHNKSMFSVCSGLFRINFDKFILTVLVIYSILQ